MANWGRRPPTHRMDETVTIERGTVSQGTAGGPSTSWATNIASQVAIVHQMSASEAVRYGRENTRRLYSVVVAGNQDITNKDRVNWDSNSNKILRIIETPSEGDGPSRDITMTLVCEETVG